MMADAGVDGAAALRRRAVTDGAHGTLRRIAWRDIRIVCHGDGTQIWFLSLQHYRYWLIGLRCRNLPVTG
jgi:hypothetical protein